MNHAPGAGSIDRSLDLLTSSPAHYNCATDASGMGRRNRLRDREVKQRDREKERLSERKMERENYPQAVCIFTLAQNGYTTSVTACNTSDKGASKVQVEKYGKV